jgi:hypothetical protein
MKITIDGEKTAHKLTIAKDRVAYKPKIGSTEEERQRHIKFCEHVAKLIQSKIRYTMRGKIRSFPNMDVLFVRLSSAGELFVVQEGKSDYEYVDRFAQKGVI